MLDAGSVMDVNISYVNNVEPRKVEECEIKYISFISQRNISGEHLRIAAGGEISIGFLVDFRGAKHTGLI